MKVKLLVRESTWLNEELESTQRSKRSEKGKEAILDQ